MNEYDKYVEHYAIYISYFPFFNNLCKQKIFFLFFLHTFTLSTIYGINSVSNSI